MLIITAYVWSKKFSQAEQRLAKKFVKSAKILG